MNDVSSNENEHINEPEENQEIQEESENETSTESYILLESSIDYSSYFENLTTIAIFQCTLIIAVGCIIAWVKK